MASASWAFFDKNEIQADSLTTSSMPVITHYPDKEGLDEIPIAFVFAKGKEDSVQRKIARWATTSRVPEFENNQAAAKYMSLFTVFMMGKRSFPVIHYFRDLKIFVYKKRSYFFLRIASVLSHRTKQTRSIFLSAVATHAETPKLIKSGFFVGVDVDVDFSSKSVTDPKDNRTLLLEMEKYEDIMGGLFVHEVRPRFPFSMGPPIKNLKPLFEYNPELEKNVVKAFPSIPDTVVTHKSLFYMVCEHEAHMHSSRCRWALLTLMAHSMTKKSNEPLRETLETCWGPCVHDIPMSSFYVLASLCGENGVQVAEFVWKNSEKVVINAFTRAFKGHTLPRNAPGVAILEAIDAGVGLLFCEVAKKLKRISYNDDEVLSPAKKRPKMESGKLGPPGVLFEPTKTTYLNLPYNTEERLLFLQRVCAHGDLIEVACDQSNGGLCFYVDEQGLLRENARVNTNSDLALVYPGHNLYGTVFLLEKSEEAGF